MIEAKIIADSVSPDGVRVTTLQLKLHRFVLAELNTHRIFSRNASSSRAIPVKKMLAQVWNDPAVPVQWGANRAGMQAKVELIGWRRRTAEALWRTASKVACGFAWGFMKIGLAKQVTNRILESWQWAHVVVTSTEWENFFALRDHEDAQPEIRQLAQVMKVAMLLSVPVARPYIGRDAWHLPYVSDFQRLIYSTEDCLAVSAAACARVSYLKHDGERSSLGEDVALLERLVGSEPRHASPVEHQCFPLPKPGDRSGNFRGWGQYRKLLESGARHELTPEAEAFDLEPVSL